MARDVEHSSHQHWIHTRSGTSKCVPSQGSGNQNPCARGRLRVIRFPSLNGMARERARQGVRDQDATTRPWIRIMRRGQGAEPDHPSYEQRLGGRGGPQARGARGGAAGAAEREVRGDAWRLRSRRRRPARRNPTSGGGRDELPWSNSSLQLSGPGQARCTVRHQGVLPGDVISDDRVVAEIEAHRQVLQEVPKTCLEVRHAGGSEPHGAFHRRGLGRLSPGPKVDIGRSRNGWQPLHQSLVQDTVRDRQEFRGE